MPSNQEHHFAQYIRALGKGKNGARPLTQAEAYDAMRQIMDEAIEPVQLGAFLMLMRIKEETAEEIAGFTAAVRESIATSQTSLAVDLDWSSYAGKRRHLPWFLLSALLLAQHGKRVVMHGAAGHTSGRIYTEEVLPVFGLRPAKSFEDATQQLQNSGFSYLPLGVVCPRLQEIMELRPLFGLRSPVHTLARMLNPFDASHIIQGIFHPGYSAVHQQAAQLLDYQNLAVFKGEGGEPERDPDIDCIVKSVHHGELSEQTWEALFPTRHVKEEELKAEYLLGLWNGQRDDEFAKMAVIGTTAIALQLLDPNQKHPLQIAIEMWEQRDLDRFSATKNV